MFLVLWAVKVVRRIKDSTSEKEFILFASLFLFYSRLSRFHSHEVFFFFTRLSQFEMTSHLPPPLLFKLRISILVCTPHERNTEESLRSPRREGWGSSWLLLIRPGRDGWDFHRCEDKERIFFSFPLTKPLKFSFKSEQCIKHENRKSFKVHLTPKYFSR